MLIMDQPSFFVEMLHDISEKGLLYFSKPLHLSACIRCSGYIDLCKMKNQLLWTTGPTKSHQGLYRPSFLTTLVSASNGILISLICSVPLLLCSLLTLIPLFCFSGDLSVTRIMCLMQKGTLNF